MNNPVIRVSDVDLPVLIYRDKRVITTALLAQLYGTEEANIRKNYHENAARFIEGEHFFKLEGAELKAFKNIVTDSNYVPERTARLMLWTDRGASRHSKILDTEQAWAVFDKLEDAYFNPREHASDHIKTLSDPSALRALLLTYSERVIELEETVKVIQPKADALERLSCAEGSLCVTDAAKALKQPPRRFFANLSARKWLYRRAGCSHWLGYQDKVQAGYLEHKVETVTRPDGSEKVVEQVRVTPKGLAKLAQIFGSEGSGQ
jgi:phage antirepressor YoqD-like protein